MLMEVMLDAVLTAVILEVGLVPTPEAVPACSQLPLGQAHQVRAAAVETTAMKTANIIRKHARSTEKTKQNTRETDPHRKSVPPTDTVSTGSPRTPSCTQRVTRQIAHTLSTASHVHATGMRTAAAADS